MNARLRGFAQRVLPGLAAERAIQHERSVRAQRGVPGVARQASERLGCAVVSGTFEGMQLADGFEEDIASPVLKLLGSYEPMLGTALEVAIARRPPIVANVGCADGYYAVGLARRLPTSVVHAYDLAASARTGTGQLAALNQVSDRVYVHGRCRKFPKDVALVICDIEGGEDALLDVVELGSVMIIVETHDQIVPGVCNRLQQRFSATHDIEVMAFEETSRAPAIDWMTDAGRRIALDDMRESERQRWLVMVPR